MKKTFIHHDGALGDLLLSLPAIHLLKGRTDAIHLAAGSAGAGLFREAGVIDDWTPVGSSRYSSLYSPPMTAELRAFLAGFDEAAVFTARRDSPVAGSIASVIGETRVVETLPPPGVPLHVAEHRLRQLSGHPHSHPPMTLALPQSRVDEGKRLLRAAGCDFSRPLLTLHPGSGGRRKCWPIGSYLQFLSMVLKSHDPFLLLISGPAEDRSVVEALEGFAAGNHGRAVHLGGGELGLVAAILSLGDLHIGNDSGITHLAAVVGGPVAVLFGPTDPLLWRPMGNATVVTGGAGCAPCGDEPSRLCKERICLEDITPRRLMEVVGDILSVAVEGGVRSHM